LPFQLNHKIEGKKKKKKKPCPEGHSQQASKQATNPKGTHQQTYPFALTKDLSLVSVSALANVVVCLSAVACGVLGLGGGVVGGGGSGGGLVKKVTMVVAMRPSVCAASSSSASLSSCSCSSTLPHMSKSTILPAKIWTCAASGVRRDSCGIYFRRKRGEDVELKRIRIAKCENLLSSGVSFSRLEGSSVAMSRSLRVTFGGSSSFSSSSSFFCDSSSLLKGCTQVAGAVDPSERTRHFHSVRMQAGRNEGVNAAERVIAAIGYFLPFFDGIQYGRYFFLQYPAAERLLQPLFPLLQAYKSFPYSNFIAFFALYLAIVRNPRFSRYVRFNTMQAVVLDVLLIFPSLVERTFTPRGGIGFELLIIFYNTTFLFLLACFLFGVFSCLLGKTPRLPIVADAADVQV
jgi:hypothetical protein